MPRGAFFCSITAAQLVGVPLPRRYERADPVHVAVVYPQRALTAKGVTGHKVRLMGNDVDDWGGLPISSPERLWCELASVLSLDDLVIAGDYLLFFRHPLTTLALLTSAVSRFPGRRGRQNMREALPLLSNRSQSPEETKMRLLLTRAGITGFEVNYRFVAGTQVLWLDFAFPHLRVFIEYQGAHHLDPEQRLKDMSRRAVMESFDWYCIEVNRDDKRDTARLVALIRRVLDSRATAQGH